MTKYIVVILISFITISAKCQCTANAGNDTLLCASTTSFENYFLGGTPTATGQNGGFSYLWETYYVKDGNILTASDFLDDPTAENPHFISSFDSLIFYLTVTDAIGSTCRDTVQFLVAPYIVLLDEVNEFINQGDTISLTQTSGGIGTYPYTTPHWTPNYNMINADSLVATVFPDTSTYYYLSQIDSFGCFVGQGVQVWVIPNSVDEISELKSKIKLFPSISEDYIQICHEYPNSILKFCLFSLSGIIVKEEEITEEKTFIFIGDLVQGMYYVQIILPENESVFSIPIFKK